MSRANPVRRHVPVTQEEKLCLDLVTFENVLINYNKNKNVVVEFTLDPEMKASTWDWIGIYQAGWKYFESYLAYKWGFGDPINNSLRTRRIIFDSEDVKHSKSDTNYQFVYINKYMEVLGASRFFHFVSNNYDDSIIKEIMFNNEFNSKKYLANEALGHSKKTTKCSHNINSSSLPSSTCSINIPTNLNQVYTVCSQCKQLFDVLDKQNVIDEELETCTKKNQELEKRVLKLERILENRKITGILNGWNEEQESQQFNNFLEEMCIEAKVDANGDQRNIGSSPVLFQQTPFLVDDFGNREIVLKAIIGNQEVRIRELTKVICQTHLLERPKRFEPIPNAVKGVVTIGHAEERLHPKICDVSNKTNEEANEDLNHKH